MARKIIKQIQGLIDEKDSRRQLGHVNVNKVQNFNIAPHNLPEALNTDIAQNNEGVENAKFRALNLQYSLSSFIHDRGGFFDLDPYNFKVANIPLRHTTIKSDKGNLIHRFVGDKITGRFTTKLQIDSDISHNIYLRSTASCSVSVWTQKIDLETFQTEAPTKQYSSGNNKHTNGFVRLNFNGPGFFYVYIFYYVQTGASTNYFQIGGDLGSIAVSQPLQHQLPNVTARFNLAAGGGTPAGIKSEFVDGKNGPTLRNVLYFDRVDDIANTSGDFDLEGYRVFNIVNEILDYSVVSGWDTTGFVISDDKRLDFPINQEIYTEGSQFLVSGSQYMSDINQTLIVVSGTGGWSGSPGDAIQIAKSLVLMDIKNENSIGSVLSGLHDNVIAGENYKYEIAIFDNSGNVGPRSNRVEITAGDFTAPASVSGLSATGGLRAIRLDWTNPSDNDLKGIHIWDIANPGISDSPIATIIKGTQPSVPTSFVVTQTQTETLQDDQSYTFYVSTFDWAGNETLTGLPSATASTNVVFNDIVVTGTVIGKTLADNDGDTKMTVEDSADEDKIRLSTAGQQRMLVGNDGAIEVQNSIESNNFQQGITGWRVQNAQNGLAEFEHIRARGSFKTTIFEKESIAVHGGEAWIANAAKVTGAVNDTQTRIWVDNATGFTIDEILKAKKVDELTSGNFSTEYMKITDVVISGSGPDGHIDVERYWQGDLSVVANSLLNSWTNGTSFPYDTFTSSNQNILDITKNVAAGIQGAASNGFSVISGNRYYVECDVTVVSGTAPKVFIANNQSGAGSSFTAATNLIPGHNEFIMGIEFNAPLTPTTGYIQIQNNATAFDGAITGWRVKLTKDRTKDVLGDAGGIASDAITYKEGQVLVTAGRVGTGYIRLNARSSDPTTPFMDIVERTGIDNYYDLDMKVRLGDLSGLTETQLLGQDPSTAGFGLFSENVFLTGGINASFGNIGRWSITGEGIESLTGDVAISGSNGLISLGQGNIILSGAGNDPFISIKQVSPGFENEGIFTGVVNSIPQFSIISGTSKLSWDGANLSLNNATLSTSDSNDRILIDSSDNRISFFDTNDNQIVSIGAHDGANEFDGLIISDGQIEIRGYAGEEISTGGQLRLGRANGTIASPLYPDKDDLLGIINYTAYDQNGGFFTPVAQIEARALTDHDAADAPAYMAFDVRSPSGGGGFKTPLSLHYDKVIVSGVTGIGTYDPDTALHVVGEIKQSVTTSNVSNPPTDAELNALFTSPTSKGDGWTTYVKDSDSDNLYQIVAEGSDWHIFTQARSVRVEDYGAVGDGSTNDSAAIAAAIATGALYIIFDDKDYAIGSQLTIPFGVSLIGTHVPTADPNNAGKGTTLLRTANIAMFNVLGPNRVTNRIGHNIFQGIQFKDGSNIGTTTWLNFKYADSVVFRDCSFYQPDGNTTIGTALTAEECWDWRFINCIWKHCGDSTGSRYAIRIFNGATDSSNDWQFIHCRWQESKGNSIQFDSSGAGNTNASFWFTQCKFEDVDNVSLTNIKGDVNKLYFDQTQFGGCSESQITMSSASRDWHFNQCLFANGGNTPAQMMTFTGSQATVFQCHFQNPGSGVLAFIDGAGNNIQVEGCTSDGSVDLVPDTGGIPTTWRVGNNPNFITENSGTSTITNPSSSVSVTHNLGYTPRLEDISVFMTSIPTNGIVALVPGSPTATTFNVTSVNSAGGTAAPTASLNFSWNVKRSRG